MVKVLVLVPQSRKRFDENCQIEISKIKSVLEDHIQGSLARKRGSLYLSLRRPGSPVVAGRGRALLTSVQKATMDSRSTVAKVIQTNDHCTVSKRSVEALYYPKPHFYRYFVKKKKTRAPLVNRGYWLRMQIIERNVKKFLYKATSARKVIINLGCGYDALPFHMLARERQACQGTTFVDVDYPPVVENKANVIRQTHELSDLLDKVLEPCEDSHAVYRSENYVAIGTDLGDLDALKEALEDAVPRSNCTFLVMAEVSLTYMTPHMADQLISWAAGLGPGRASYSKLC